jgi:hypothetical protein
MQRKKNEIKNVKKSREKKVSLTDKSENDKRKMSGVQPRTSKVGSTSLQVTKPD